MNEYEVLSNSSYMKIKADCYHIDEADHLDLILIDEEGLHEPIATFNEWSYVKKVDSDK